MAAAWPDTDQMLANYQPGIHLWTSVEDSSSVRINPPLYINCSHVQDNDLMEAIFLLATA